MLTAINNLIHSVDWESCFHPLKEDNKYITRGSLKGKWITSLKYGYVPTLSHALYVIYYVANPTQLIPRWFRSTVTCKDHCQHCAEDLIVQNYYHSTMIWQCVYLATSNQISIQHISTNQYFYYSRYRTTMETLVCTAMWLVVWFSSWKQQQQIKFIICPTVYLNIQKAIRNCFERM